jgi:hypothetical protein
MTNSTSTQDLTFDFTREVSACQADYQAADVATKRAIKKLHEAAQHAAIMAGDIEAAQHLVAVGQSLVAAKPTKDGPDYGEHLRTLVASLEAALDRVKSGGAIMPEGVDFDFDDFDFDGGEADMKLVRTFATISGRKSGRGNVVDWIDSVVTDEPLTIAQLRSRWVSTSDYPKAPPSQGAIGAAFDRVESGAEASFEVTEVNGTRAAVLA